ncbi:MAG TPA: HAMP domain-containing sensor histidine kinase [Streptosporangiaceae bacterium]|jgi:two-component system OmpR family sensor kinase|nr:HAMP domain-containing sensor histidine kinase [Streptosporangiaceae bacterium]
MRRWRRPALLPGGSLRTRLLLLQLGVATLFLLVLGTVGTLVLSSRLNHNFDSDLIAESLRSPTQLAGAKGAYAAVGVALAGIPQVVRVTAPGPVTKALAVAVQDQSLHALLGGRRKLLTIAGNGVRFRAVVRLAQLSPAADSQVGLLVIGRPVGEVGGQVRAFVIAELITGGVLIALLAVGGGALIGRGLEPLGRMARTADGISSGRDLDARMPGAGGRTEVGRLSAAINTMLDRLQHAFAARLRSERKVREFAADASHELRTPLTTIRGYAELYRQGALGPDELPDAMRRIEQEAQRMSALVAELLELARLDRPTSLDLAETDLALVVRDAVADAAAVEPGRPVRAEAPDQLVATVDERRIRQVLANLLGNVRAHTPPDTPAAVRLAAQPAGGGGVLIEVADQGPGMPAVDAARAFDRFHRASRPDGTPGRDGPAAADRSSGSGLGLSIVQAIAHAHGGQATLESAPGQGTRVLVYLPSAAPSSSADGVGRFSNT